MRLLNRHSLLAILAFFFLFSATFSNLQEIIGEYNKSVSKQQNKLQSEANNEVLFTVTNCGNNPTPFLQLLILLFSTAVFLTINKSQFSIVFTTFPFLIYLKWHLGFLIRVYGEKLPTEWEYLELIQMNANLFDYLATAGVFVLLLWQISILFRMLFKYKEDRLILA